MKQPDKILPSGTLVRTHATLQDFGLPHPSAMFRRSNQIGVIRGIVGGLGGDVYWVEHGREVGVYHYEEFELEGTGQRTRFERVLS